MKKRNKIFFITFMTVWILIVVINFIFPKKTFSEQENRMLATIPRFSFTSFVNGDYLNGVNDYINDHFAFRNIYLKINSWWETSIMRKNENNGVYVGKDGYLFEKYEYGQEEQKNVIKNIKKISQIAELEKMQGIPTYFILVPNSIYINSDKLPNNVDTPNQKEIINKIFENTKNTININVTDIMNEYNKITPLYFKTDHHMNSDGAYVVYSEFCKKANLKNTELSEFNKEIITNEFLGTFDSKAQIINQEPDQITVYKNDLNTNIREAIYDKETTNSIFNEDYLDGKDKYSYFLNGSNSRVVVKTNVKNNKKLLVIKDSYAHIMAQFLCQNYNEVHFLDPRYTNFDYGEYIKENNFTDILFLYNVSTFLDDNSINKINYNK